MIRGVKLFREHPLSISLIFNDLRTFLILNTLILLRTKQRFYSPNWRIKPLLCALFYFVGAKGKADLWTTNLSLPSADFLKTNVLSTITLLPSLPVR